MHVFVEGRAAWQRNLWLQLYWSWDKGTPQNSQVTNEFVFPHTCTPLIEISSLLESQLCFCCRSVKNTDWRLGKNPFQGRCGMISLLLSCCGSQSKWERWADFWMGGTRTDESLYLWWHGLMTIAVRGFSCRLWNHIKGVSCLEEVVSYKIHSGMEERHSGKALLWVPFPSSYGTKLDFLLTKEAQKDI